MLVVMEQGATEAQITDIVKRLEELKFKVNRVDGVVHTVLAGVGPADNLEPADFEVLSGVKECHLIVSPYKMAARKFRPEGTVIKIKGVEIGGKEVISMAGPCSIEGKEQISRIADIIAEAGAKVIRGGAFKPRSSPYSFQGMGEEGLQYMREAADRNNLLTISEVMDASQIEVMLPYVDILQIGARNMQNFAMLKELGKCGKPCLLKRGMSATIEETLLSAEYLLAGGNHDVIICERGIRTFETATRNTMDISAIPVMKQMTHLPMVADPSHGVGRRDMVIPLALASVAAGADAVLVEVHYNPDKAWSDGAQTMTPEQFKDMMAKSRLIAQAVGRTM
jgi:3-deoxy-7-phosphoheptulonate synthase